MLETEPAFAICNITTGLLHTFPHKTVQNNISNAYNFYNNVKISDIFLNKYFGDSVSLHALSKLDIENILFIPLNVVSQKANTNIKRTFYIVIILNHAILHYYYISF